MFAQLCGAPRVEATLAGRSVMFGALVRRPSRREPGEPRG
jgi:hypothetical protein